MLTWNDQHDAVRLKGDPVNRFLCQDFYRILYENSLDAILLTHPDGTICRANPAACRLFQMTEEELCLVGRSGVVDQHDPRLQPALDERERNGKARVELTFIRKDKVHFAGEVTSAIFQDESGTAWSAMIIRDISDMKQIEKALRKAHEDVSLLADIDDLTKVLNRRAFVNALEREMRRSAKDRAPMCLILMDLDHFKQVNDQYGHLVGDQMLRGFSLYLQKNLRPNDIVGRYGGDEFIVCLPDTTLSRGIMIAERLRQGSAEAAVGLESCSVRLTASFGVVAYAHASGEKTTALIKRVDQAMYRAKEKRDCVSSEAADPGSGTPAPEARLSNMTPVSD